MTEFTAAHFEEICAADPVKSQLEGIETVRAAAVKQFWMFAVGGGIAALVLAVLVGMFTNITIAIIAFVLAAFGTIFVAFRPLEAARKGLKQPVLAALAARGGLTYAEAGFKPPYYATARKAMFGGMLSGETFTDMFEGRDADGKAFAIFEATLEQGSGKSRQTIFTGQMYGFESKKGGGDVTVITPDKGLFNFFKPGPGMERVKFESNPEFEKRFEVYSTNPSLAAGMLGSSVLQNRLLELRGGNNGKVLAYIGGAEVLIAINGPDRFEPGSMFKAMPGQERARIMFDDVCGSLALLKELRAAFG